MKKKLLYLITLCLFTVTLNTHAQLAAGDIAFIGFNSDAGTSSDDDFTWIALTDIPSNEIIYFTEQGVDTNTMTWFNNTEGHFSWTAPSGGLPCGTIVHIYEDISNPDTFLVEGGGTVSNLLSGVSWSLSAGDQVIAYQASTAHASIGSTTFISGIHMEDDQATGESNGWTSTTYSGTGTSYCMLPPGLTNGVNCISLFSGIGNPEIDNAKYTGTLSGLSTDIRSFIATIYNSSSGNWTVNDTTPFVISPNSYSPNVTCVAACTDPTVPTVTASVNPVCNGASTTLSITGTLNDATQWAIYTGSCGGSLVGTTASSTFVVSPTGSSTTYYVRGEGGCVTPGTCGSITINVNPALTASISSQTNVACNGGTNGAATVTPSGGTSPFNYSWSPSGITTATATGLSAGTYTVIVTDANNCSTSTSVTITEPTTLALTPSSQTNVSCNGGSNGAAAVNVATGGGNGPYTYNWTPGNPTGDGTPSVTGLSAGTWTCTVTDANSCTTSVNFTITQPTALALTASSQTNVSCNGGSNGIAAVNTATGGAGGYTYNWTPGNPAGDGTPSVTGLSAGTWTCTVTDANSCTTSVNFTITQPTALALTASSQTDVSCNGGSNGIAAVNTATGGAGGYTYNWTPGNPAGDGTPSVTGLSAGTWTCTVTDANSCTTSVNFTITQPTALIASPSSQTNVSCNGGTNGSATVSVSGGTPSYTYAWSPSGGTAATATGLSAGIYTVTVTDANACTATQSFTITEPTAIIASAASQTNVSCNGGTNGSATVSVSGGTPSYTYAWSPSGGTAATATGLSAGIYTVTVTDANACTATQSFTITEPTAIIASAASQTNVSCNGGTNGSATVSVSGGTPSYTYAWSPSGGTAATATGLSAGIYTVTVTDANACTATQSFTITEPTAIIASAASQTNVSCNGGTNGTATVSVSGGTPSYTYAWSPSGGTAATATGLSAGIYTVTVTDANACTATQSFTITEPTAIIASAASQTNVSCNGGTNGSATVSVSGGTPSYTYAWSPSGGTAATATGLSAGIYTVTVTDANACTATQSFTITEPTAIIASAASQTNVSCNGGTNGSATVSVSGGTPGYTYSWAPSGGTASFATGLAAGTYTCTVTDTNGCQTSRNFTITEPTAMNPSISSQTNVACNGGNTGAATVTPIGGAAPYTYSWSNGSTTASITGVVAGFYNVIVTDANGCTGSTSVTITEPSAINNTISENTTGILTANESGATYQWFQCPNTSLNGETNQNFTPSTTGDYKVEITKGSCTVESSCYTVTTLDTKSFESEIKFVMYPNPTNGLITIKTDASGEFVIVNQLGQTIKSFKVNSNIENNINVENLSEGIYFIKSSSNSQIKAQRLIIKK